MGDRPFPILFNCIKMLMSKKDRLAIYEHLFNQGVMVAKKDFHAPKHPVLDQDVDSVTSLLKVIVLLTVGHLEPMATKLVLPDQDLHLWNSEEDLAVAKPNK